MELIVDTPTGDGGFGIGTQKYQVEHRDIARIQPTDGLVINRTKGNISPFVPIIRTPVFAQNSGNQTGYSIEIEDPTSPTGYHTVADYVSPSYLLIPNQDFFDLGKQIIEQAGHEYRVNRIFWDGARFAVIFDIRTGTHEVGDGDQIGLSLVMRSSYNKSWSAEVALMGRRFLCDNGVLSGEFFAQTRFKHVGEQGSWEQLVKQGLGTLASADANLTDLVGAMRRAKETPATQERLRDLFTGKGPLALLGPQNTGKIMQRFWEHEEHNLFGLVNAGTNVFWHDKAFAASHFDLNRTVVDGVLTYSMN